MQHISVIGVGRTPVGEHWGVSLRELALEAIQSAMADADIGPNDIDAIVIGNALAEQVSHQGHIGPMIADYAGLRGLEAHRVEGADAAGGLAIRLGAALVGSNAARTVLVLGIEKITDCVGPARVAAHSTLLDAEYEAIQGATPVALAGLIMRRYMHTYNLELSAFEGFSINAHANGHKNADAMFRNLIKPGRFATAPMLAEPVSLFDSAPEADGAAALILTATDRAVDWVPQPVHMLASAAATDTLVLHERDDLLFLRAVNLAAGRAFSQANLAPQDIDILELHDSFTVLSALQLEAAGFAARGEGWRLAANNQIASTGDLPISTFGGLKARGNPLGATGVYQAAEVILQLRDSAGDNQLPNTPMRGMSLNVGGVGSTAAVHIWERANP